MADVVLRDIHKLYPNAGEETIKGIDLDIDDGEFTVLVGPSGCGKSTLLRMVAGLEEITAGELRIGGRLCNDVPPSERGIAMVFQNYALYPHMSLFDNMAFALQLAKVDKAQIARRVEQAAEILQIDKDLHKTRPGDLSGGQRQRVAIGRAIVREPSVFLFDEPLSNLDAGLRVAMRIQIARLHARLSTTSIYVTHDQVEAMTMATKIVVLNKGRVAQCGAPLELYSHPDNRFVAEFIGSPRMNMLSAELKSATDGAARVVLADKTEVGARVDASRAHKGATVALGIRPEHAHIMRAPGGKPDKKNDSKPDSKNGDENNRDERTDAVSAIPGQVALVEHLGEQTLVYVETDASDDLLVVREPGIFAVEAGETVRVQVAADACYLFDSDDRAFARHAG